MEKKSSDVGVSSSSKFSNNKDSFTHSVFDLLQLPVQPELPAVSQLRILSIEEVLRITDKFSTDRIMTEGDSWAVYRGEMSGKSVAVHQLQMSRDEVESRLRKMQSLSHDHTPRVVAWCPDNDCIVVETREEKSLREKLDEGITWQDCCRLAFEIASAIQYLICEHVAVEGIDSVAVSLDKDMKSKLVYSIGTGPLDKQQLVFRAGLLFLELLTTLSNTEIENLAPTLQTSKNYVEMLAGKIDPRAGSWPGDVMKEFLRVTMACLNTNRQKLTWKKLVTDLGNIKKTVVTVEKNSREHTISSSKREARSPDEPKTHNFFDDIYIISPEQTAKATANFSPLNVIGKGGFGTAYKGRLKGVDVAIKRLHSDSGNDAFFAEVQLLHTLRHPHVLSLIGFDPKTPCLVSEYISGGSLDSWLEGKRDPLSWDDKVRLCREMSSAVLYMHSRNIIHRDLKLPNVLLDEHRRSRICDMGLAKFSSGKQTAMSVMQGTAGYMDPHVMDTGYVSKHSDTYALGLIMVQLLTGMCRVGDVHRLLESYQRAAPRLELPTSVEDSDSDEEVMVVPEEDLSLRSRWDPEKFDELVSHFRKLLDPSSAAMPRVALEKTLGLILCCMEKKWEMRTAVDDLLVALEELEAGVEDILPLPQPVDVKEPVCEIKSPLEFESRLSDIQIKLDALAFSLDVYEFSVFGKFQAAAEKRRKVTKKMFNALKNKRLLESQITGATEDDKSRLSLQIEIAEEEARAAEDEVEEAEEEYDAVRIGLQENDKKAGMDWESIQLLTVLRQEAEEEAKKIAEVSSANSSKDENILATMTGAFEVKSRQVLMEQQTLTTLIEGLRVKLEETKTSLHEDKRLLMNKNEPLMEELQELQQHLAVKLSEVNEQEMKILAVNQVLEPLVANFNELTSGLETEMARAAEVNAETDKAVEKLRDEIRETETLKMAAERNMKMIAQAVKVGEAVKVGLVKEVEEDRVVAAADEAQREKLEKLASQERAVLEERKILQLNVTKFEDSLKVLNIAQTRLQQDRAFHQKRIANSEKKLIELQNEKKEAATLKNYKEAILLLADAKFMADGIVEAEKEILDLNLKLIAVEQEKKEKETMAVKANEALLGNENLLYEARCDWLQFVAVVANHAMEAAIEREDYDTAELLKLEPDLATEEAEILKMRF